MQALSLKELTILEQKLPLFLGEEELKNNSISFKELRKESSQVTLTLEEVIERFKKMRA